MKGARATEDAARLLVRTTGALHLATHGRLNPDNPLFSRMDLRPSPGNTGTRGDGRLEVHEILGLDLRVPLVYLSGCETALGEIGLFTRGDDFLTLSQSFLFAGARVVIATLWRIPDVEAGQLVEAFYQNLDWRDPAMSLARAQRALIATPAYHSPYYWAGYIMTGAGPVAMP